MSDAPYYCYFYKLNNGQIVKDESRDTEVAQRRNELSPPKTQIIDWYTFPFETRPVIGWVLVTYDKSERECDMIRDANPVWFFGDMSMEDIRSVLD